MRETTLLYDIAVMERSALSRLHVEGNLMKKSRRGLWTREDEVRCLVGRVRMKKEQETTTHL